MLKQTIKKNFKPKNYLALALVLLVILIAPVNTAHASVSETVLDILGWGISFFVSSLGMLLSVIISALVEVAQYDKFLSAPPVAVGWGIVRDLCNMFFVLILLMIAFATILHISDYSIKQLLKRVIIFAILINFSKMICGLLIDFAQVIMLTFVNGFKDIGKANITTLLGMDQLLSLNIDKQIAAEKATFWSVVGSYFLALIYVIIMLVVMVALLGTLVFRIITLWIYIILSPLAYLGAVVPKTGITSAWWKQFSQSLVTGPILAFFIWLSLATLGQYKNSDTFLQQTGFNVPDPINNPLAGTTEVGTTGHMMRFAISISLLIGGLMVAKQFGGSAGGAISGVVSRAQRGAGWMKKKAGAGAKRVVVAAGARPAYAIADKGLGVLEGAPLIGGMASRKRADLKDRRESDDDKALKKMRFHSNKTLNRMASSQGLWSEKKRQDWNRATQEKMRRGIAADFGSDKITPGGKATTSRALSVAAKNKTTAAIAMAKKAGGEVANGKLAFRDVDKGKKVVDFMKANVGSLYEKDLKDYFTDLNKKGAKEHGVSFKPSNIGDVFNPKTGAQTENPKTESARKHFAKQLTEKDILEMDVDELSDGVIYDLSHDEKGRKQKTKVLARVYDNGPKEKRERFNEYAVSNDPGGIESVWGNRDKGPGGNTGWMGASFMTKGVTANPTVASGGVTGLNNIAKGRFSVDFAELDLPPNAVGQYIDDPREKEEIVSRLSDKLRAGGMSEDQVGAIANQLNSLSYIMLRNKGTNVDLATSKAAQAHEWSHARVDQNFNEDEKQAVWDSLDDNAKADASQKIKAIWGNNMSDKAVRDEYLAEGIRDKTRWNKDTPVSLDGRAEATMNQILSGKGTSVDKLVSNITDTRPLVTPNTSRAEASEVLTKTITEGMADNAGAGFDPTLTTTMEKLIETLGNVGNGLRNLSAVAKSVDGLDSSIRTNNSHLIKQAEDFKQNSKSLEDLGKTITRAT